MPVRERQEVLIPQPLCPRQEASCVTRATAAWTTLPCSMTKEVVIRMAKVRWGILSTANIGMTKVNPAIQKGQYCEIVAIASPYPQAAEDAAHRLAMDGAHGAFV